MKKLIVRIIIVVLVLGLAIAGMHYFLSTRTISFKLSHVENAVIKDKNDWTIATLNSNSDTARLYKGSSYTVHYDATDGYQDSSQTFTVENDNEITVSPYYSNERLSSLLAEQSQAIRAAVVAKYPTITGLYDFQNERLYHYGEWYSATLKYKGNDFFNEDKLRLVVHKQNDTWHVASQPPMPSLNTYNTGDTGGDIDESTDGHSHEVTAVPVDILRRVNAD